MTSILLMSLFFASLALFVLGILGLIRPGKAWWRSSRKRAGLVMVWSVVALLVTFLLIGVTHQAERDAKEQPTQIAQKDPVSKPELSKQDQPIESEQSSSPEPQSDEDQFTPDQRRAIEFFKQVQDSEEQSQTKDDHQAKCRKNIECWNSVHKALAGSLCQKAIETHLLENTDYEWVQTYEWEPAPRFSTYAWKDEETGVLMYMGSQLLLQNKFGKWERTWYSCDYDSLSFEAVSVTIERDK